MRIHRRVADQGRLTGQTVAAHARSSFATRDQDRDEVRHRRARGEDAARRGGETEDLAPPADHAAFDLDGGVIAAADVGIHAGGEQRRDDTGPACRHRAPSRRSGDGDCRPRTARRAPGTSRTRPTDRRARAAADRSRSLRESPPGSDATADARECPLPHRNVSSSARCASARSAAQSFGSSPASLTARTSAASQRRA